MISLSPTRDLQVYNVAFCITFTWSKYDDCGQHLNMSLSLKGFELHFRICIYEYTQTERITSEA